eukprot:6212518-Pleurochrysis_carterae.AAC.8
MRARANRWCWVYMRTVTRLPCMQQQSKRVRSVMPSLRVLPSYPAMIGDVCDGIQMRSLLSTLARLSCFETRQR